MFSGAAIAEPLTVQDKAYVVAAVASMKVLSACPVYEAVTNSFQKYGDQLGVDSEVMGAAVLNGMRIGAGMDYDRTKLLPEVTRLMNDSVDALTNDLSAGKAQFCKKWGDFLSDRGLIHRK